jgi:site-specific DNA recombinase
MSNRAALYLRSSKDRSDVSIDAQRRALHELAQTRNLVVIDEFADAVESGKDDDRPAFQRLLRSLKDPGRGWEWVLVLDTSRIARRRTLALIFETECAKRKVGLVFKSVPDADPITEMLLKSILQAMDEWHSLNSKAKGIAGMAENVRQGWRAGGRAPRGYRLEYVGTGAIREGEAVLKSRLVLGDDAELARAYLAERAKGKTRGQVIASLALPWPSTSLHSMDWQALTYAGHTVWNMAAERVKGGTGEKRRPRSEWLINRNTHEALITDAEAEKILGQMEGLQAGRRNRAGSLLLTGLLESPEGEPWHSDGGGFYRLAKGKRVLAKSVDDAVLRQVKTELQAESAVERVLGYLKGMDTEPFGNAAALEKKISNITIKIGRTVDLAAQTGDPAPVLRRVTDLEAQRQGWIDELAEVHAAKKRAALKTSISTADVRVMLQSLFSDLATVDQGELKSTLRELIGKITLDPTTLAATVHYALLTGDKLASRRGVEPLLQP